MTGHSPFSNSDIDIRALLLHVGKGTPLKNLLVEIFDGEISPAEFARGQALHKSAYRTNKPNRRLFLLYVNNSGVVGVFIHCFD
jgi:hypothetical protein